MDSAIQNVELEFKRIANNLQYASHRLDTAMAKAAASGGGVPDVYRLVRRLRALQRTAAQLEEQSRRERARSQACAAELSSLLLNSADGMAKAYARLGCEVDGEWAAAADAVRQQQQLSDGDGSGGDDDAQQRVVDASAVLPQAADGAYAELGANGRENDCRRNGSGGGVSQAQFLALPTSIRGRCRLDDVQHAYNWLLQHCSAKPRGQQKTANANVQGFTRQELAGHGCKVAGHTGECVLKTLKQLKLIQEQKGMLSLAS